MKKERNQVKITSIMSLFNYISSNQLRVTMAQYIYWFKGLAEFKHTPRLNARKTTKDGCRLAIH